MGITQTACGTEIETLQCVLAQILALRRRIHVQQ